MSFRNVILALAVSSMLVACGGSKTSTTSTTTETKSGSNGVMTNQEANPSPSTAVDQPAGAPDKNGNAMAVGTMATQPPGLNCGAVQPVWVNTKSHVYHEPNDPYYGRTKHGEYMCPSQAKAQGYHKAGAHGTTKMKSADGSNPDTM